METDYPRYLHTPQGLWVQRVYGREIYSFTGSTETHWLVSVATARFVIPQGFPPKGWEPAYKRHYNTPKESNRNEFLLASVRAYMAEIGSLLANCQQPEDHSFPEL